MLFGIDGGACTTAAMRGGSELLTVVMPVFNAMPYLDEAIESVLGQTHADFRFAIYDDHSDDGSYERALEWAQRDSRIDVTRGERRLGPSRSSNAAAALATTELVARMDADDVMALDRLDVQLAALRAYPDAALIGSTYDLIDGKGRVIWKARRGRTGGHFPPISHPTILYRRTAFLAAGGYRENADYFEDRDLILRMAEIGKLIVINRPLLHVRCAGQHARLRDDLEGVLHKINRLYAPKRSAPDPARPLSPMAFYSIATLAMLSSRRPHVFGLMLRKVRLDQLRLLAVVGTIIAMAEMSPRLARNAWRIASRMRNMVERKAGSAEPQYEWSATVEPETAKSRSSEAQERLPVVN